ncbi:hypothetical protein CMU07_09015 [Elizabethkingia anophelis]|nr:hypothetical protein [Elizabethkingia anophelis]
MEDEHIINIARLNASLLKSQTQRELEYMEERLAKECLKTLMLSLSLLVVSFILIIVVVQSQAMINI